MTFTCHSYFVFKGIRAECSLFSFQKYFFNCRKIPEPPYCVKVNHVNFKRCYYSRICEDSPSAAWMSASSGQRFAAALMLLVAS